MAHTGNLLVVDLHQQTIDNCTFMTSEDTEISIITSKEPEGGKFRAMVIKDEGYGSRKKRSVLFSDVGVTVIEALGLLHTKSAEALNHHIMTNGFEPVREKSRRKPRDWDDDGSDTSASSSGSDSDDTDDSQLGSNLSEDDGSIGKAKKKSKKHRSSSRHRTGNDRYIPGRSHSFGPVGPPFRSPPPPGRMPPLTTMPRPPPPGPPRHSTGPGGPPTIRGPPGIPPGLLPSHSRPQPSRPFHGPPVHNGGPVPSNLSPPGGRSRDVRIGITWASHRQQIMLRCLPSRRVITTAALRYFNAHRGIFGADKEPILSNNICSLKEIVLPKGSAEERYDMSEYCVDDLSEMCDSAIGTAKKMPLFEVTVQVATGNNEHSDYDW